MDHAAILQECSTEIAAFRNRQVSTFREVAIVQGLITWGVVQLNAALLQRAWFLYYLAAAACALSSALGCWIIWIFKRRILIARMQRSVLVRSALSFPLHEEIPDFLPGGRGVRSSTAYICSLLVVGLFTTSANLVAATAR